MARVTEALISAEERIEPMTYLIKEPVRVETTSGTTTKAWTYAAGSFTPKTPEEAAALEALCESNPDLCSRKADNRKGED